MEIVSIKKPKTTKEQLVNQFTHEIGGVASYWKHIPAEQLRALHDAVSSNADAKEALKALIQQLQDAKQTNSRLNQTNFGLNQTAAKYERIADHLTKMNALLEKQKNELLKQIQGMVNHLTNYDNSEIRQGIKTVAGFIGSLVR